MNTGNYATLININVWVIVVWFTGLAGAFSQDYLFDTEIINVEDGLPHRMTYYVLQDKKGFIWVNTQGAISRYDGHSFKTYTASFLNIEEIKSAEIGIDANNRIWYYEYNTTDPVGGVIDTAKDSIYSIETISGGRIASKDIIHLGNTAPDSYEVYITTRSGSIYKYDDHLEEIYCLPSPVSEHVMARKVSFDNSYWIVHGSELFRVKDKKIVQNIPAPEGVTEIISTTPDLIVQTAGSHVPASFRKLENDTLAPFFLLPGLPDTMQRLLRWHKDYICYATDNAIVVRDKTGNLLYRFDEFAPAGQKVKFMPGIMLTDRQDILWITTQNGLVKFTAKKNPFTVLLPGNSMRGIFKDKGILWLGGDMLLDATPDTIRTEQAFLNVRAYDAMSFYKDRNEHLWIGTEKNKIIEYNPEKDRYLHYEFNRTRHHSLQIPFQNPVTGNYFIGTTKGLFRFDKTVGNVTLFPLPAVSTRVVIRHVYQNPQGIWLAGSRGIFLMDAETEMILKHYTTADGLPTNSILHIHEDREGIFWLGTGDAGLVRWDRENDSFRQYTRENELSNNKIYAVYEDDFETLWLPSDYGLMAFDKNTTTVRVYLPKDGIAHEEFNYFSHFQDTDGTLYFGGLNGITVFHPRDLLYKTGTTLPLYTTRVRVLEKNAETFTDKTHVYNATREIVLNPGDRILELDLTLLDYERSAENHYAYKLSGKQEQWVYTRNNRLSIINPPYGKYDLVIKARGASGMWSENLLTVPVHVRLPFYRQWWFILLVVLTGIISIYAGMRWRVQKLKKDRTRLETEVQNRTRKIAEQAEALQTLDKAKSRFFANITHEFRTPLTLVAGPVEQMIAEDPPPGFKDKLKSVLKNTRNLMDLINQLLDLSKLEGDRMKIEVSHGDIIRYTKELVQRFQPLVHKKQVQLEFQSDVGVWEIHIDIDKWTKIVYNLVSNAIKFTPEGGRITVSIEKIRHLAREDLQLRVTDTGIGMALEHLPHIFDRFYQADASSTRLQGGTGIGLSLVKELTELLNGTVSVKSVVDKGTGFTVILPVVITPADKTVHLLLNPENSLSPLPEAISLVENELDINGEQPQENKEKLKLLIVEDNEEMRAYIRSCIDVATYSICEAGNGQQGIEKALEIVPDLIISDVMMPKKNGFELTEAIRTHLATSHIPLILLTAKASLESRLEGLERGADAYLTKPFSPQELTLRIKKLIELRKLLQERYQSREHPPEESPVFKKEDGFISELKNYILENLSEPGLGVENISKHFAMSRVQLYRKLKALIGTPVANYIRGIRLEEALRLLKKRELNVTEIAYETGFSPSNFSKIFKKAYGKAPSEFL